MHYLVRERMIERRRKLDQARYRTGAGANSTVAAPAVRRSVVRVGDVRTGAEPYVVAKLERQLSIHEWIEVVW
jgi:hypothetical protein